VEALERSSTSTSSVLFTSAPMASTWVLDIAFARLIREGAGCQQLTKHNKLATSLLSPCRVGLLCSANTIVACVLGDTEKERTSMERKTVTVTFLDNSSISLDIDEDDTFSDLHLSLVRRLRQTKSVDLSDRLLTEFGLFTSLGSPPSGACQYLKIASLHIDKLCPIFFLHFLSRHVRQTLCLPTLVPQQIGRQRVSFIDVLFVVLHLGKANKPQVLNYFFSELFAIELVIELLWAAVLLIFLPHQCRTSCAAEPLSTPSLINIPRVQRQNSVSEACLPSTDVRRISI
jgi:hypothetical protein